MYSVPFHVTIYVTWMSNSHLEFKSCPGKKQYLKKKKVGRVTKIVVAAFRALPPLKSTHISNS